MNSFIKEFIIFMFLFKGKDKEGEMRINIIFYYIPRYFLRQKFPSVLYQISGFHDGTNPEENEFNLINKLQ